MSGDKPRLTGDTIAAIATANGRGGIGIIRLSGPDSLRIAAQLSKKSNRQFKPRYAHYLKFFDSDNGDLLDEGIGLYFPAPNSFTGEDVVELQGHGGPVILNMLLTALLKLGARQARPGEFSERAFLNDKLDLSQAEAIADLIESSSEQAARSAMRSLQGEFSKRVNNLQDGLINLRMHIESAIDFPEEEIDFLADQILLDKLTKLQRQLKELLSEAKQGLRMAEGIDVVIAGKPNAGKSSLMNALSGRDDAIVTDIPGTTRDLLKQQLILDGVPVHLTDTAGLRDSDDVVEREGIRRAQQALQAADVVLYLVDATNEANAESEFEQFLREQSIPEKQARLVLSKNDLQQEQTCSTASALRLSSKTGNGLATLIQQIKSATGIEPGADQFSVRQRHVDTLGVAEQLLNAAAEQLTVFQAGELAAEELRHVQDKLAELTGEYTADDLLGSIFSSFCIGK